MSYDLIAGTDFPDRSVESQVCLEQQSAEELWSEHGWALGGTGLAVVFIVLLLGMIATCLS